MNTSIEDLQVAVAWLNEYGGRLGSPKDESACIRVARWLDFVIEQRSEYDARKRGEQTDAVTRDNLRMAKLKSAVETVWRARRTAA